MYETPPTGPSQEELNQLQEEKENKQYEEYLEDHPETVPEEKLPYEAEAAKFEQQIAVFEATHSLEALHAINELTPELATLFGDDRSMSDEQIASALEGLTPEDAERYQIRSAAKKDLIPIFESAMVLKEKTIMSDEMSKEYFAIYKKLSRAVGMLNSGTIDHTR